MYLPGVVLILLLLKRVTRFSLLRPIPENESERELDQIGL